MQLPSFLGSLVQRGWSVLCAAIGQRHGQVQTRFIGAQVREVYERAIANVPPAPEKRYWQRYIYLWIRYALWEELEAEDAERTRQVYKACLNLIPHSIFTFAKVSPPSSLHPHRAADLCTSASPTLPCCCTAPNAFVVLDFCRLCVHSPHNKLGTGMQ